MRACRQRRLGIDLLGNIQASYKASPCGPGANEGMVKGVGEFEL